VADDRRRAVAVWIELDVAAGRKKDRQATSEVDLDRAGGPIVDLEAIAAEGKAFRNAAGRNRCDQDSPTINPANRRVNATLEGSPMRDLSRKTYMAHGRFGRVRHAPSRFVAK